MHELPIEHKHLQSSGGWKSTADTIQRSIKTRTRGNWKSAESRNSARSPRWGRSVCIIQVQRDSVTPLSFK